MRAGWGRMARARACSTAESVCAAHRMALRAAARSREQHSPSLNDGCVRRARGCALRQHVAIQWCHTLETLCGRMSGPCQGRGRAQWHGDGARRRGAPARAITSSAAAWISANQNRDDERTLVSAITTNVGIPVAFAQGAASGTPRGRRPPILSAIPAEAAA